MNDNDIGKTAGPRLTSIMRMTFGCLINFIVDISRLICIKQTKTINDK